MSKITVLCPAKINLFFNIIGLDSRNYHLIHGLNQTISLYDKITIKKTKKNITIECNDPSIPTDDNNSIHKAIILFFNYTKIISGIKVQLTKNIPTKAGLGGESTDIAGTLLALNTLFKTNLSEEELLHLNYQISCDAPFCFLGGSKEVKGCGEIITTWHNPYNNYIIITPNIECSTKEMFSLYDAKVPTYQTLTTTIGHNDFHLVVPKEILNLKNKIDETSPITSFLSGSGSSIVAIYKTEEKQQIAYSNLLKILPSSYKINLAFNCLGPQIKK